MSSTTPSATPSSADVMITVRPLDAREAERLAAGEQVQGYALERFGGHVNASPATFFTEKYGRPKDIFATPDGRAPRRRTSAAPADGSEDAEAAVEPIGQRISFEIRTKYGTQTSSSTYTSPEAAAADKGNTAPKEVRYVVADPEGQPVRLAPEYGSQVTITLFVKDVGPEQALETVQRVVHDAFPAEAKARMPKAQSRAVLDHRVNVFELDYSTHPASERLIATNMLSDEAIYLMSKDRTISTVTLDAAGPLIIGE